MNELGPIPPALEQLELAVDHTAAAWLELDRAGVQLELERARALLDELELSLDRLDDAEPPASSSPTTNAGALSGRLTRFDASTWLSGRAWKPGA